MRCFKINSGDCEGRGEKGKIWGRCEKAQKREVFSRVRGRKGSRMSRRGITPGGCGFNTVIPYFGKEKK